MVMTVQAQRERERQVCTTLGAHSHISDCHVFIRCNSTDPFIVKFSQRLVLGIKTVWFMLKCLMDSLQKNKSSWK